MFFCCSDNRPKESYQVVRKNEDNESLVSYVPDIKNLDKSIREDKNVKIRPVRMSDYNQIFEDCKKNKKKFQDVSFPPNNTSLGNVMGVKPTWKRIPQFLQNPTLFDEKIEPKDVVHSNVGDCYLLSSIAALAENPEIIKTIFHGQSFNQEGVYRVVLNMDGIIQEVVVDDFIPLNQFGAPIFCQPTIKETSQFWTLILEKALAKVKGSYANIMEGVPSQIFRAVTYCPAESLVFEQSEKQKIWNLMVGCSGYNEPFCATTKDSLSKYSGLTPEHTYTVIAVTTLTISDMELGQLTKHGQERIVKLRNPWVGEKDDGWRGRGALADTEFWNGAQRTAQYNFILKSTTAGDYGVFYMTFNDFCKNFNQIHYCNFHNNGKTVTETLFADKNHANGSYFDVIVKERDLYTFELNQSLILNQTKQQRNEEGICRSTLILISNTAGHLQYLGGAMKPNEDHLMLTLELQPGNYILYANLQPTRVSNQFPDSATVNIYSSSILQLVSVPPQRYPTALKDAFLNDGLAYEKKMVQNNGLMTISYRLLFQQGGFGYIVFHNDSSSDKSFVINYEQEEFNRAHLNLVVPAKHDKKFEMRVTPGNNMIVLARAKNEKVDAWKFPPKMSVHLEQCQVLMTKPQL